MRLSFVTKPLADCVDITQYIDQLCFPEEMWLTDTELSTLLQHNAEATILTRDKEIIGQAITIPEQFVADSLSEVDKLFYPTASGVYSYSEAILPDYQNKGYGTLLIDEIAIRMRERGFTRITAHVRTRYGWNVRRKKKLHVGDVRTVSDFWSDPADSVVEFQIATLLPRTVLT